MYKTWGCSSDVNVLCIQHNDTASLRLLLYWSPIFSYKTESLTFLSSPSLLNAISVNLINRLPPALYPSTNNYANKNQWSNNRKSLARQLKHTMAHRPFQKGATACNKEGDRFRSAGKLYLLSLLSSTYDHIFFSRVESLIITLEELQDSEQRAERKQNIKMCVIVLQLKCEAALCAGSLFFSCF